MSAERPGTQWPSAIPSLLALVVLALLGPSLTQAQHTAVGAGGPFNAPTTWNTLAIPGPGDTVNIPAGATVTFAGNVSVDTVNIFGNGAMIGTAPLNTLSVTNLTVDANGTLRGFDNTGGPGGSLTVLAQVTGVLTVQNDGLMRGGHPNGNLFVMDTMADSSCSVNSSITSNGGTFEGGNLDGDVFLVAGTIALTSATAQGGNGQGGNVYISGLSITLAGSTTVLSGNNTAGPPGSLAIMARNCGTNPTVTIGPGVFVNLGTGTGGGCLNIFSAGTSTILGTIGSPITPCGFWDPPDLVLSGDGNVSAKELTLAGDSFTVSGLSGPGLMASQTLNIILSPGGVLDLRYLEPGQTYFHGGEGITLCADEILLDRGVGLEELMEPAPRLCEGRYVLDLVLTPATTQQLVPGQSVDMVLQVTNIGNGTGDAEVTLSDSAGWLTGGPQAVAQTLDSGESILLPVTLQVPMEPFHELTELRLIGQIAGQPLEKEISIFHLN